MGDLITTLITPAYLQRNIAIANDIDAQGLGEARGLVLVLPCLLKMAHGADMAQ